MVREISFYDAENTGELISRMSDDTTKLRRTLSSNLPDGMRSLTVVTFGVFYLFIVSWKLSLAMFLVVPPIAIGLKYHGKKVRKMGKSVQQELGESAALASEALGNIRTVRSFSKEPGTLQIYAKCVDSAFQVRSAWARASGIFQGCMGCLTGCALCLLAWLGGTLVFQGEMSTGTLTAYLFYTITIGAELGTITSLFTGPSTLFKLTSFFYE
eukprot:gene1077-1626_t